MQSQMLITSTDYRRRAGRRIHGDEREKLLQMRFGLIQLADNQDWLDGVRIV